MQYYGGKLNHLRIYLQLTSPANKAAHPDSALHTAIYTAMGPLALTSKVWRDGEESAWIPVRQGRLTHERYQKAVKAYGSGEGQKVKEPPRYYSNYCAGLPYVTARRSGARETVDSAAWRSNCSWRPRIVRGFDLGLRGII